MTLDQTIYIYDYQLSRLDHNGLWVPQEWPKPEPARVPIIDRTFAVGLCDTNGTTARAWRRLRRLLTDEGGDPPQLGALRCFAEG